MSSETETYTFKNGQQISVEIHENEAVQYDFYIPTAICEHPSIKNFLQKLSCLERGATIFQGLTGIWQGKEEKTQIYRLILQKGKFQRDNVKAALKRESGRLFAELSTTPHTQQAFLYTETDILMNLNKLPENNICK